MLFLCISFCSIAQIKNYSFNREIKGVNSQWHSITLPDDLYGKLANKLQDIRIYGFNEEEALFEVPYVFKPIEKIVNASKIVFKRINDSKIETGYYFGFEVSNLAVINEFDLEFKERNFDWLIGLEGSQDQLNWLTIAENYRVLSIKNELTDYRFTKLKFPDSKYKFYRVLVKVKTKPELLSAKLGFDTAVFSNFRFIKYSYLKLTEDKQNKLTIIHIDLKQAVPISFLKVNILANYDYYRPISIKYVTDSFKSNKSWVYSFSDLVSGTLSSLENNEFKFPSTITKTIQVIIDNQDNTPLKISEIEIKGIPYVLQVRFDQKGKYFLCYGNRNALKPSYDIEKFKENIPKNIKELELGDEIMTKHIHQKQTSPLFENIIWLWIIMAISIGVIAWFTLRMMMKKQ